MKNIKKSFYEQIIFNIKNYNVWFYLGIYDVKKKYRRTFLGPIWNLLSNFILICVITLVWTQVFKISVKEFLPHVAVGLLTWHFITDIAVSSTILLSEKYNSVFQNIFTPLLSITLRNIFTYFLIYAHNFPFFILILFLNFSIFNLIYFIIGLIILFLNLTNISILLTFLGTRFRDIKPLVSSIMSAGTLLTPLMWKKEMLGKYENYVYFNPFTHFIDIIRDPILNKGFNEKVLVFNIIFFLFSSVLCVFLFKLKGSRIIYWI